WSGAPTSFAYQWLRCDEGGANCSPIELASESSYTLAAADVGATLRVQVIASNAAGPSTPARSSQTAVVAQAPQPPASTSPPTITGSAQLGHAPRPAAGEWSGAPTSFAYQWLRCDEGGANCSPIELASESSYTLAAADVGATLRVQVIASNAAGPSTPARSSQTAVVAQAPQPPANTSPPTISGSAQVGQALSAQAGEWSGAPTSFAYQWLRCDEGEVGSASSRLSSASSYTLVGADVGATLRVQVTASNAAGPSTPARSSQTAVIAPAPQPPANTSPPTISGSAQVGQALSAQAGEWSGAPTSFAYQWLRCDEG